MLPDYTPRRVVSLQPSATVILDAIGKLDCVIACTKYCADVCSNISQTEIAIVSDSWTASADQIKKLAPDLVIAAVPYQEKAVSEILKAGARFLGLAPKTLRDIYTDISIIAGIFGEWDRGQQVVTEMQNEIETVRRKVHGKKRPRVFCEEWGKPIIGSQRWVAELVDAAGGDSVGTPAAHTSAEAVLAENPDVLVTAWCGAGDRVPLEKLITNRNWSEMNAVRHGRVYCIRDEFLNTPAPTLIHGLNALAAALHPQDFPQPAGLRCITDPISISHQA
ncbi:MAG: ABC transporter substrate-binding protein [Acidobacteriaceae bacterium]|nr:ABC transporter substrate-binding protein [Acidobacteriaceae bacterium]